MTKTASHRKSAVKGEASFGRGFIAFLIFGSLFTAGGLALLALPAALTLGCIFGGANSGRNAALIFRGMIYATAFGIAEMGLLHSMRHLSRFMLEQFPFDAACALSLAAYGGAVAYLSEISERTSAQATLVCVSAGSVSSLMALVAGSLDIDGGRSILVYFMFLLVGWVPAFVGWSFAEYVLKGAPFPGQP